MEYVKLEHTDQEIFAHDEWECVGDVCPIHKRTDHAMRAFPQHWRGDRYLMERICPHGVGHPDPDHLVSLCLMGKDDKFVKAEGVHGCDGCCQETGEDHED